MKYGAALFAAASLFALVDSAIAAEPAARGGNLLKAELSGTSEVPPGPPAATGSFTASINAAHDQLCYELHAMKFDAPTAAHIHVGMVGQNGGPVVMLQAPVNGMSKACVPVTNDLAAKLWDHPENYYVNVHNAAYPGGGLRGQLSK